MKSLQQIKDYYLYPANIIVSDTGCWTLRHPATKPSDYYRVCIRNNGQIEMFFLHRVIVALHYCIPYDGTHRAWTSSHLCNNKSCLNEWHLIKESVADNLHRSLGTIKSSVQEAMKELNVHEKHKLANFKANRAHKNAKTDSEWIEMFLDYSSTNNIRQTAKKFGVHPVSLGRVISGKYRPGFYSSWKKDRDLSKDPKLEAQREFGEG